MTDKFNWIRTCQSCGHQQVAKCPKEYKNDSWQDLQCKKCKSIDFDYGTEIQQVHTENEGS
jgi:transcription elongation factor Elf1